MAINKSTSSILIDAVLVLFIAVGIIVTCVFLSTQLAYGLAVIVGIWFIDAYLKKSFDYPNEALFADLSFAAFIFFGGQNSNDIMNLTQTTSINSTHEYQLLPIVIGLCILWLGNLRLCRGLFFPKKYLKSLNHVPIVWTISLLFAFISTAAALIPQILVIINKGI